MGFKKVSFSTRLYKRGAFSHFLIRDWEASESKNHFCGKMELFTHILDCEASQYTHGGDVSSVPVRDPPPPPSLPSGPT